MTIISTMLGSNVTEEGEYRAKQKADKQLRGENIVRRIKRL